MRALLSSLVLGVSACAAPNLSRTVGRGNGELHVSHGGPLVENLGAPLPVPHTHVGGRYGVTDDIDVDANVNLLPAVFKVWAMDLGGVFQLYRRPRGLAVSTSTKLHLLGDLDDAPQLRLYPELGLHLGGPVVRWLAVYGGATLAHQFRAPPAAPAVFLTPFFGLEFLLPPRKGRQHGLAAHASWTNPWADTNTVVDYSPGRGAIGVHLGYRVRFGGLDR